MPYATEIINKLDAVLAASAFADARFANRYTAGLVQQIPVKSAADSSKVIFIPAKVTALNDAQQVVPDDSFNLITYHRMIANNYSARSGSQQFGDTYDERICTSDVIMVVIGFTNKLKLIAEQLEALIVSNFPNLLEKEFVNSLQMNSISIDAASSSFDSVAIFSQEYRGEAYFIKPEMSLFQIRYRIEAAFNKSCFELCDCISSQ